MSAAVKSGKLGSAVRSVIPRMDVALSQFLRKERSPPPTFVEQI